MMAPDSILSLLCKLNDTIDAQQRQIDQLQAEVSRLQPPAPERPGDVLPCDQEGSDVSGS